MYTRYLEKRQLEIPAKLPRIAYVVAYLMAGLIIITAVLIGPIVVLPSALIPLIAAVGIMRGRVWSAYGFSVYLVAQLLLLPVLVYRSRSPTVDLLGIIPGTVLMVLMIPLFLLAGKSLGAAGSKRGGLCHGS
jgi:hypothetical protein